MKTLQIGNIQTRLMRGDQRSYQLEISDMKMAEDIRHIEAVMGSFKKKV